MAVPPIPDDYRSAVPYLIVKDAARALAFYQRAFGATEVMRLNQPDGRVGHAEMRIGKAPIMLADEFPEMGIVGPQGGGRSPVILLLYVEDVDARFNQAVAAGATVLRPVKDQFYGDRTGTLTDPFGHVWTFATHTEDVSHEEVQRRHQAAAKQSR
jgi:PhnB protein